MFQRWADFLVDNSLHPRGVITADGLDNPDMSNLALKGILGVYSMAKINEAVGVSNTTYMASCLCRELSNVADDSTCRIVPCNLSGSGNNLRSHRTATSKLSMAKPTLGV